MINRRYRIIAVFYHQDLRMNEEEPRIVVCLDLLGGTALDPPEPAGRRGKKSKVLITASSPEEAMAKGMQEMFQRSMEDIEGVRQVGITVPRMYPERKEPRKDVIYYEFTPAEYESIIMKGKMGVGDIIQLTFNLEVVC